MSLTVFSLVILLAKGIVAAFILRPDAPLSPLGSGHALGLGGAKCIEAVHEGNADLDFGCLVVGSREAMRSPNNLRHVIVASILLRA